MANAHPIGVFDSGIGGLSILKALRQLLPHERFVYFADSAHNPYGEKSEAFVQERTLAVARELVEQHQIKAFVVACNTATASAIALLRAQMPHVPIVGVEPALKPAAKATRSGRVLVLATRGTLQSDKFAQLKSRLEAEAAEQARSLAFACVPCDGLAERIERQTALAGHWQDAPDLIAMCAGFIRAGGLFEQEKPAFDTLVLGCTHYPLISDVFRAWVGESVTIMDNAQPVALRTAQLLQGLEAPLGQTGSVAWQSSAHVDDLVRAAQYWGIVDEH